MKKIYNNKNIYECQFNIPTNIFQTWHTTKLPPLMAKSISIIRKLNPKFNYYLFDDNDCREFIKKNFNEDTLNAYDILIPGAYKADLWRYCVLYIYGGIYMDIKYFPINGFKFYNLLEKEHFVLDINDNNIYNALMVCKAGNPILLKAIEQICKNVNEKYYGNGCLDPTGPGLLSHFFSNEDKQNFDMKHTTNATQKFISYNNEIVLKSYPNFLNEKEKYSKIKHYSILWKERKIYK